MRTITILAFNRPHYLEQCLDALAKCRGIEGYRIVVSYDGPDNPGWYVSNRVLPHTDIFQQSNLGIDHHNSWLYDSLLAKDKPSEFIVALEDDVILSPDALELADWYYAVGQRDEYLYMSLGDPHYRKEAPAAESYCEIHECRSIYTSAWCFTRAAWEQMRPHWNRPLKTQLGWDWSLSFAMNEHGWKSIYPLVSRAHNIGREGVHSYPEFFDTNIGPTVFSDGRKVDRFDIAYKIGPGDTPAWIQNELKEQRHDDQ